MDHIDSLEQLKEFAGALTSANHRDRLMSAVVDRFLQLREQQPKVIAEVHAVKAWDEIQILMDTMTGKAKALPANTQRKKK